MQASLLFSASALSVVFQPKEVHGSWQQLLLMWSGLLLKNPLISSQVLTPCSETVACQTWPAYKLDGLLQYSRRKPGFLLACLSTSHSPSFWTSRFSIMFSFPGLTPMPQLHHSSIMQRPGSCSWGSGRMCFSRVLGTSKTLKLVFSIVWLLLR